MWGMIVSLVQGIVTGVVGPAFTYLGKKQDVNLDGFKAGTAADQAAYQSWVDYQIKIETLKLSANGWWGPRILYMIVGGSSAVHFAAVNLDSVPFWFHQVGTWSVPKLPGPYDTYEGWVVASLFVVSLASGPVSAATAWLHRR
jgi:hypothetical protein